MSTITANKKSKNTFKSKTEIEKKIEEIIDKDIRPFIQMDGGE